MSGRDVIGIAQTGTGKTAAFALPILHHLAAHARPPMRKSCRVLVLSPTRELSGQILESFRTYGRHLQIRTALAIGGVSMGGQVRALINGVDVLVATPGRLLDLVQSNSLRLNQVECLVLDEADRMLDMGFIRDIRKIVAKLPVHRQTLMFSATMPRAISELVAQMLRDPIKVAVAPTAATADRIEQRLIRVDRAAKPAVLIDLLRRERVDRALIFTRTKHGADKVVRGLIRAGTAAHAIHGNKSQNQRQNVLAAFRKGATRILVATDIAARGIDVDGISHVINFDVPNVPETYVHRIGRTARAGAEGVAISLCDTEEAVFVKDIEKLIRMSIPATDRRVPTRQVESLSKKISPSHRPPERGRSEGRTVVTAPRPNSTNTTRTRRRLMGWRRSASCMASPPQDASLLDSSDRGPLDSKDHDVAKEELLQFEGLVVEILPDARYRVVLDNGHALVCYTAGRMKKNRIKTLAGDRVTIEVSPYDLEKGRLIFRHKDERAGSVSRPAHRYQFRRR